MDESAGRVILGLDPGMASTGFGVVAVCGNRLRALDYGVVETPSGVALEKRLESVFSRVSDILEQHHPDATAVESLFFNTNVSTALAVGHARGVSLLACSQASCEVFEYTPQQVKMAVVGYGKATKQQVMEMVRVLLGLSELPRPDHAADALGVAICHANTMGIRERISAATAGKQETRTRALIERLQGEILAKGAERVVLGVSGVGFLLDVSAVTLRDTPGQGEQGTLFTHLHVRDDALQLFGFSTEEERELFRMFLGVSKIGPKLALAALSCRRPPELKKALARGDVDLFASVPGIGRKTAERLILELREKMGDAGVTGHKTTDDDGDEDGDAVIVARSALVELGYSVLEADKLLGPLDPTLPVEELVKRALGGPS